MFSSEEEALDFASTLKPSYDSICQTLPLIFDSQVLNSSSRIRYAKA
jgi:hypothetical protein